MSNTITVWTVNTPDFSNPVSVHATRAEAERFVAWTRVEYGHGVEAEIEEHTVRLGT